MSGKIFIISAPSGAGKTTLVHEIIKKFSSQYTLERVITYTSRSPRPGEKNGYDYHFIPEKEFKKKIKQDFFLEYSTAYGTYYGSPRCVIEKAKKGISSLLVLDRNGAQNIASQISRVVLIWIRVDMHLLRERLLARNSETYQQIEHRLFLAQKEVELEEANSFYDYHIFNNNLEHALASFQRLFAQVL